MRLPISKRLSVGAIAAVCGLSVGLSTPQAMAQSTTTTYQTNLTQLNTSGTSGTATVTVTGNQATVRMNVSDASPSLVHAQHIHIGGRNICPDPSADTNDTGFISTVEGQPFYGEVKVSLTTSGATGADSVLALDRFPKANADGSYTYQRTFTLPSGVTADTIDEGVVVVHGVSTLYGDKTRYDGAPRSLIAPDQPFEATAPAACGKLTTAGMGGVNTGGGATDGVEYPAILAIGAAAIMLGLAGSAYGYSRVRATRR